jgi:Flp pilus assembly protein TadD
MRLDIVAAVCTVTLFVVLAFLVFSDNRSAEWRAQPRLVTAKISPAPASDVSSAAQATTVTAPQDVPNPVQTSAKAPIEVPRATLNQILDAAAHGNWLRVDELLLGIPSASAGSGGDEEAGERLRSAREAIDSEKYRTAIEILTAAVDDNANDAEALNLLAFAELRRGRRAEAQTHVAHSLAIEPHRAATWANAAEIFAERGNKAAAEAALRVGVHLSQHRERTLRVLAQHTRSVRSAAFRGVIANVVSDAENIPSIRSPS